MFAFIRNFFTRSKDSGAADEKTAAAPAHNDDENADDAEPLPESPHASRAWLGLGLDGALSLKTPEGLKGPIGPPVANTVQRLRDWVEHRDLKVKILTPRAATEEGALAVRQWLKENGLPELPVTHRKNLHMVEFWSAHCVQVISNTGQIVGSSPTGLDQREKKAEESLAQASAPAAQTSPHPPV